MNTIRIHQHETFERSYIRWIWLVFGVCLLIILSFVAPLRIHNGHWWSMWSRSNWLNAWVLLLIIVCYIYAAVLYNKKIHITYTESWVLNREWKQRTMLTEFSSYSLTHHGSQTQYYTLFLLNDEWYSEKTLPFADTEENISIFIEYVEKFLTPAEEVKLYWYEKIQRFLKI